MKKVILPILAVVLAVGLVLPMAPVFVSSASPPEPTYDTAVVDGNEIEWDLVNDFFADMYRGADPDKKLESKLYLRYDCDTGMMYVLVLAVENVPVVVDVAPTTLEDAHVKIDGSTKVDGTDGDPPDPPDFEWIRPVDEDLIQIDDNDLDGLVDEDPVDQVDNDGDGLIDEDDVGQVGIVHDNDGDGLVDEDPVGDNSTGIDNDGDGLVDEDLCDGDNNDGDGLVDEDPVGVDDDCDGLIDEDPAGYAEEENLYADGYEARFLLAEGSYSLDVHCNVLHNGGQPEQQTSAVKDRDIPLEIDCEVQETPTPVGGEVYPISEVGSETGVSPLWVGLGVVLILAIGGGVLVLRHRRAH